MVYAVAGVYNMMLRRFSNINELSLRKRFSISYLKWKKTQKMVDMEAMVDLAKEFRKVEGVIGGRRTKLERLVRRRFQEVRKHRSGEAIREGARKFATGQKERGEGIHKPEEKALNAERWKQVRQILKENKSTKISRNWVVTDSEGNEFCVRSLKRWCEDHNIHKSHLHATAHRPWRRKTCKGYRARHYDEILDAHLPWAENYEWEDRPNK